MSEFISFLAGMPFWYWWVLAVGLLILEIATGTTYVLWPAIAAVIVGIADIWLLDGQWQVQLFLFAAITFALTIYGTPYAKRWLHSFKTDHENLNKRGAQKIGQRATVSVAFTSGKGKVKYGDTQWIAESDTDLAEGTSVEIIDVRGTTMVVKAV
ncbi:MAG: NfeD family protein [Aquisalinus sp.]|nr:NfeD family protein [Aquisalinus sp.]